MINGNNDYFFQTLDGKVVSELHERHLAAGLARHQIQFPSDTIIFGEKKPTSSAVLHGLAGVERPEGNDWTELNQTTHTEGSDYCFRRQ
jgi:hypothetical protein